MKEKLIIGAACIFFLIVAIINPILAGLILIALAIERNKNLKGGKRT